MGLPSDEFKVNLSTAMRQRIGLEKQKLSLNAAPATPAKTQVKKRSHSMGMGI